MGNVQVQMAQDTLALRRSLAGLCAALQDGIAALIDGQLDDFKAAVEAQSIEVDRTRKMLRSQAAEVAPEIVASLREAALLTRSFNAHLRKLGTLIEVAKNLRLLIESKYPGTANHAVSSSLSLKV